MFIRRPEKLGPTQCIILEVLTDNPSTAEELEKRTRRARSTISEGLTILTKQGIIIGDNKRPQRYSLAEVEL
jgi:predicted transcriptional regulator